MSSNKQCCKLCGKEVRGNEHPQADVFHLNCISQDMAGVRAELAAGREERKQLTLEGK